jgi:hypothetical protein
MRDHTGVCLKPTALLFSIILLQGIIYFKAACPVALMCLNN